MKLEGQEIFLLAGETSGDLRGAELIRALRSLNPSLRFSGMGGPQMRTEGMEILADVTDLAVVGIFEVLKHYSFFKETMDRLLAEVQKRRPAIIIGIDYPGFNLRFLKKIKAMESSFEGKTPKRIQFVSPQLWAWNRKRKWEMAKYLDLVLCLFPFEPEIYKETGLKTTFVGHPLANSIPLQENRRSDLIALFPGSRQKEILSHMPILSQFEINFSHAHPGFKFAYASNTEQSTRWIRSYRAHAQILSPAILRSEASVGIVCSGTATLEAALAGLPMCVIYRVAWPTYLLGRALIKIPYLAMPNVLAQEPLVKEFIQSDLTLPNLVQEIERLLKDHHARAKMLQGYQKIRSLLERENSIQNAAREILSSTN